MRTSEVFFDAAVMQPRWRPVGFSATHHPLGSLDKRMRKNRWHKKRSRLRRFGGGGAQDLFVRDESKTSSSSIACY